MPVLFGQSGQKLCGLLHIASGDAAVVGDAASPQSSQCVDEHGASGGELTQCIKGIVKLAGPRLHFCSMQPLAKQPAVLRDIIVDEVTWRYATRPRRAEWQAAIEELVAHAAFAVEGTPVESAATALHGQVVVEPSAIAVTLRDDAGAEVGRLQLDRPVIAPVLREYLRILQAIEGSGLSETSPHFEALDIARRLVHDDAAQLVQRYFSGVHPDQETARQLFSLMVLLTHDTSRLAS